MKKIIIDGSKYSDIKSIHQVLKNKLSFPDYYGYNLDALWDILTGWVEYPLIIEWLSFKTSKEKIGEPAIKFFNLLKAAEIEIGELSLIVK